MNEEIKERYEKVSENELERQYGFLLNYCKKNQIAVLHLNFQSFKKRARQCGYVLGMKPKLPNGVVSIYDDLINFENDIDIGIPFAHHKVKSGGRNPMKRIPNIPDIKAFGMSMSLRGWYLFLNGGEKHGITCQDTYDKIRSGRTIEELWMDYENTRTVSVDGKKYDLKSACNLVGVKYNTLMKAAKGLSGKSLQISFDKLKERLGANVRRNFKGENWVRLSSEDDLNALLEYAKSEDLTPSDALHKLIESVTY